MRGRESNIFLQLLNRRRRAIAVASESNGFVICGCGFNQNRPTLHEIYDNVEAESVSVLAINKTAEMETNVLIHVFTHLNSNTEMCILFHECLELVKDESSYGLIALADLHPLTHSTLLVFFALCLTDLDVGGVDNEATDDRANY